MMLETAGTLNVAPEDGGVDGLAAAQAYANAAAAIGLKSEEDGSAGASDAGGAAAAEPVAGLSAEDLRKRASAYVQQQLALFGQPVSTRAVGAGSTAIGTRRDSLSTSVSCAAGGVMAGASFGGAAWPGLGMGGSISMAASLALAPRRGTGGGSGRGGRGRVRRPRSSCDDDPDDETYVPAGSSLERELARCGGGGRGRGMTSSDVPHGDVTHQQAWATTNVQWPAVVPGFGGNSNDAHAAAAAYEAYAVGCLPGAPVTSNYHGNEGASLGWGCHPESSTMAAFAGVHGNTTCPTSALVAGGSMQACTYNGVAATASNAHLDTHLTMGHTNTAQSNYNAGSHMTTMRPPSGRGSLAGSPLLGLEDAAVAFEAFRRSGGDFKLSLGCLDDLLGGHSGRPSAVVPDWTGTGIPGTGLGLPGAGPLDANRSSPGQPGGSGSMHPPRPVALASEDVRPEMPSNTVNTCPADTRSGSPFKTELAMASGSPVPSGSDARRSDDVHSLPPAADGAFGSFVQPAATQGMAMQLASTLQQQQQLAAPIAQVATHVQASGALGSPGGARLPSTFHSVLQALLPAGGGGKLAAAVAGQQQDQQLLQPTMELPPASMQQWAGTGKTMHVSCSRERASSAGRASRRSSALALFSPGPGGLLCESSGLEALLLAPTPGIADRALPDLGDGELHVPHHGAVAGGDGAQVRAERRSLRLLLGALANCDPAGAEVTEVNVVSTGRVSLGAGAGGGGGSGSSSRVSLSSLRSSSRGLPGWFGFAASPAAVQGYSSGPDISVAAAAAAMRRTARLSNATLPAAATTGHCGGAKRQRQSSGLLLSPTGYTGTVKRHRISSLASTAALGFAAGNASGGGGLDECLSYWRV